MEEEIDDSPNDRQKCGDQMDQICLYAGESITGIRHSEKP